MFSDLNMDQVRCLDTAVSAYRTSLQRKRDRLNGQPVTRNFGARERQLAAIDADLEEHGELLEGLRARQREHVQALKARLGV